MACFIVSGVEALVVTAVRKVEEKKEVKETEQSSEAEVWGGAILLAFEHVWHGEVVPWFPFLTAMSDPGDAAEMFHEMATVGVAMAALVTAVWIVMCIVANAIVKRPAKAKAEAVKQ